jgi:anti-sigma-K factor RskA
MFGQPREDMRVADYVLGLMDADEARFFERELKQDPALAARVEDWRARVARFEDREADTPQAEMRRRIEEGMRPRGGYLRSAQPRPTASDPKPRVTGPMGMATGFFIAGILFGGTLIWLLFGPA